MTATETLVVQRFFRENQITSFEVELVNPATGEVFGVRFSTNLSKSPQFVFVGDENTLHLSPEMAR